MRPGRKPAGTKLVEHVDGSEFAKKRLEVILKSINGELTIEEATNKLGVERSRFHELRSQALQAMATQLEPRPAGRPRVSKEEGSSQVRALREENQSLKWALEAARVREEVSMILGINQKKRK